MARIIVVAGLVSGITATAAAPAFSAPTWSIQPSPSPPGPPAGQLDSVSCASPTSCFAVGGNNQGNNLGFSTGNTGGTFIEHWDGTSWSIVPSPTPAGANDVELDSVSCPTTTSCFAVGNAASESLTSFAIATLIEEWNGTSWSIVPSPTPAGATEGDLNGVSCTSPTSCFAVGESSAESETSFSATTLTEQWNGTSWSIVPSPNPSGAFTTALTAVSCTSPTTCFAVGDYSANTRSGVIIDQWNGASWSTVVGPTPIGPLPPGGTPPPTIPSLANADELTGVACTGSASCFAVGSGTAGAFIARWGGTTWTEVTGASPGGFNGTDLAAVSCAGAGDCTAVGESFTESKNSPEGETISPLIEHFNGAAWSIVSGPSNSPISELNGVSCPTSTSCAAVGDAAEAERFDGTTWSVAPFTTVTSQSQLLQVTCPSPTSCFAVGSYGTSSRGNTLVEHWNGTSWSLMASPNPSGSFDATLNGISCPSTKSCTAVGSFDNVAAQQTLIEHWDGTRWSIVPSPSPKGDTSELIGVACASSASCNAVGLTFGITEDAAGKTLAEHWNGKAWAIVRSANPSGAFLAELIGVACPSATNCTAVGTADTISATAFGSRPLIEHWNGTSWSITAGPAPNRKGSALLTGVSCPNATSCTAVGFESTGPNAATTALVERFNGKAWTIVNSPTPAGAGQFSLLGVACPTALNCTAVGNFSAASVDHTLVEHSNGASWSIVASPAPAGSTAPVLNSVACPSSTTCVAVGSYGANDGSFTLAERGT